VLATNGFNITGETLRTTQELGYALFDVGGRQSLKISPKRFAVSPDDQGANFVLKEPCMPIPDSWLPALSGETSQPYYLHLYRFIGEERRKYKVYPPGKMCSTPCATPPSSACGW